MFTRLQQSTLVLSAIKNVLDPGIRTFRKYITDDELKFIISAKLMIDLCSFLDEWKKLGPIAKEDPCVMDTLKMCGLPIKKIKAWDGLKSYRNTMLAHGFRDETAGNTPTNISQRYFNAKVPTKYAETLFLAHIASFCIGVFLTRHGQCVDPSLMKHEGEFLERGIGTIGEFDEEIKLIKEHFESFDSSLSRLWENNETLNEQFLRQSSKPQPKDRNSYFQRFF
jgi:hypothetical protein